MKNFILFVFFSISLSDTLQLQLQELSDVLIKFYQAAGPTFLSFIYNS